MSFYLYFYCGYLQGGFRDDHGYDQKQLGGVFQGATRLESMAIWVVLPGGTDTNSDVDILVLLCMKNIMFMVHKSNVLLPADILALMR